MIKLRPLILGTVTGLLIAALLVVLAIIYLPHMVTVCHTPSLADAIVILGGDSDSSRLRKGLQLHDENLAPHLILVSGGNSKAWQYIAKKHCPDCNLEGRAAIFLDGSIDTRTDAQLTLAYCRKNNLQTLLVVTSPYHSRRSQFVFNDILAGSGITATVISSGDYGRLLTPNEDWWRDRVTLETVWLEFGKILFWELTPFMEWPKT
ncbi:MAG: YdcF family protein [Desulfuromonadales bacterium]|nr:YdcF family protein [Desulfuromonadales bacterium]